MNKFNESTLVVIKPDAMERNLAGEIIARFERVGLKMINAKMVNVSHELAADHYPVTDEWLEGVGGKSLSDFEKYGVDAKAVMGTDAPAEIGKLIHKYNKQYLTSGPVLALVFQ